MAVVVLGAAPAASAGSLKNAIRDLYGGDGILLAPTPPPFPSHAPHFTASSLAGLESLSSSLASTLSLFSFNSSVSGFTFDIERGVPVRTTETLGPLLAERARTIGRGRFNVGVSYTRIEFSRFEGKPLDELSLIFRHEDVNGDGILGPPGPEFELDQIRVDLDLEIEEDIFALYATYGLTRNLDVGIVIPIIRIRLEADARATIVRRSAISEAVHQFGSADPPESRTGGEEVGFGDVLLRAKWNFLRDEGPWPDLALFGQARLPTGDEDDLMGTGNAAFLGMLVASKAFGPVAPHVNLGYEQNTGDPRLNNVRYVVGVDAAVHPRVTLGADLLGRWEPKGDGIGDHLVDVAVGAKWNVFGSTLVGGYVLLPLNRREGLRADVTWAIGIESTF